jgi:transcriptional regulator with XRE-family HTH domain
MDAESNAQAVRLWGLIKARKNAGLSQADAGRLISKTQSHYGKIELGKVDLSARDALALCNRLGVDLARILEN